MDQNDDDRLVSTLDRHHGALNIIVAKSARGLSLGRNTGLGLASGQIFAFPDDDCWYPKDLLESVVAAFAKDDALTLLSGRTLDAHLVPSLGVFHESGRAIRRDNVWRSGNSNTIFVRAPERRHLYFDETLGVGANTIFQSGEETDLLLRFIGAGAVLRFDPDLIVHHDQIDLHDPVAGLRRARAYAPGQGRVLRLHRFRRAQIFWFAARPLARAALAALTGDMTLARYKLAWANGLLAGYRAKAPEYVAANI